MSKSFFQLLAGDIIGFINIPLSIRLIDNNKISEDTVEFIRFLGSKIVRTDNDRIFVSNGLDHPSFFNLLKLVNSIMSEPM